MERELPEDLTRQRVLCIGVGSGAELDVLLNRDPGLVVGIDVSGKLLAIAAARYPGVRFARMDMMTMALADRTFDFVYSGLAFHYANDWDQLLAEVHRVLRPGGTLLFSTHHPGYWAQKPGTGRRHTNARGITLTEHVAILPAAGVEIVYYNHADEASITEALRHAGFAVQSLVSPRVQALTEAEAAALDASARERYDDVSAKNAARPLFLVVRAST